MKRSLIMALQSVTLGKAAEAFGVHPRTILRAIAGEHNTYWYEDSNDDYILIEDIANAYGVRTAALVAVFEGRDGLLRADEAAKVLGMAARTFRKHLNTKGIPEKWGRVGCGGITRYLETKINSAAIDRMED
jgi:hypothetical protein